MVVNGSVLGSKHSPGVWKKPKRLRWTMHVDHKGS